MKQVVNPNRKGRSSTIQELLPFSFYEAPSPPAHQPVLAGKVVVSLSRYCLETLRDRIKRDLNALKLRWEPIPFERKELEEFERLLLVHPQDRALVEAGDNLLMTDVQRLQLIVYAMRYYRRAVESDDFLGIRVYTDILGALRDYALYVPVKPFSPFSFLSDDRLSVLTRPLVVVRSLWRAVFAKRVAMSPAEAQTPKNRPSMAMNLQDILDSGEVEESTPAPLLEEARVRVDMLIQGIQASNTWGDMGTVALQKYQALAARILELQKRHHGLDGMTHLSV